MPVDLGWLAAETRRIKHAARRVDKAAQQLLETNRRTFQIEPGDRLEHPSELLGFLRLAIGENQQGALITVSQPERAQTEGADNGKDV